MATIDLGKIKLKWQGTYAGGTAYVPDDVVYYMDGSVGSSYMCVANTTGNAPSSGGTLHASWEYLAKGQATSPTTTQGDLIVRGASADERLAIGAAGKALKVNSSGNGLEYGNGGGLIQTRFKSITTATTISTATAYVTPTGFFHTITPTDASSHILITFNICYSSRQQYGGVRITRTVGGSTTVVPNSIGNSASSRSTSTDGNNYGIQNDDHSQIMHHIFLIDTPGTTSEVTYSLTQNSYNGTYQFNYNRSHNDDNSSYTYRGQSTIMLQEILASDNTVKNS